MYSVGCVDMCLITNSQNKGGPKCFMTKHAILCISFCAVRRRLFCWLSFKIYDLPFSSCSSCDVMNAPIIWFPTTSVYHQKVNDAEWAGVERESRDFCDITNIPKSISFTSPTPSTHSPSHTHTVLCLSKTKLKMSRLKNAIISLDTLNLTLSWSFFCDGAELSMWKKYSDGGRLLMPLDSSQRLGERVVERSH